jgi:putative aldouronate transport system permease protein
LNERAVSPKKTFFQKIWAYKELYLFCLPGIIITFIFHYIPLYGVQIAFRKYSVKRGFWGSEWVGLQHFVRFFNSPNAVQIITNTLILSLYSLAASFPIPILLALFLNSMRHRRYRKVIQTVTYAPNFISIIVMCGMLILFLSPRIGIINKLLELFGVEAINFMGLPQAWRHIYVWSGVWQTMGWSSVVYFAALSGVSPEYHEAAVVDGATKLQRIRYIDFPSILPVAVMLLILSFGSLLSIGFEKAYALQNDLNRTVSEIISTYTYKVGIVDSNMSYSAAIGLFNSVVNAVLLVTVNWVSGKISGNALW